MCGWFDEMSIFQKAWKSIGFALACLGLAGIIWTAILWGIQLRNLPRYPEVTSGRIYPRNIHGVVVYQNRSEYRFLETVQYCSIAIFASSLLMSVVYKTKWDE
jgi:hypothetical protein